MKFDTIRFEIDGGIARLTLNRPERLNAFSDDMFVEINRALDAIDATHAVDDGTRVRVLMITGAGRGFCAGADLSSLSVEQAPANRDVGSTLERNYNPLMLRLRALPLPVVCAVNGVAAGAGVSLALAADLVLACRSASFVLAFARIGLVPDAGATYFLQQALGTPRALALAMLGEKISAVDAERSGLIWRCVDDDAFATEIEDLLNRLKDAPTTALARTKQAIYHAERQVLSVQLGLERELQKQLGASHDFGEGVAAFRDKRRAGFQGK